jgi:hypothetical protein
MNGGTTFHFLDASPAQALTQARQAAAGRDIRIGGGPSAIREFLAAGLIDYLHRPPLPRPETLSQTEKGPSACSLYTDL